MTIKIDKKIFSVSIKSEESVSEDKKAPDVEYVHEGLKRPRVLSGSTYKIKPPNCNSALYFTINDIVMNRGTELEQRYPYEIFLNSKQMESYSWISALTCIVSATFRKGGNITFIIEEFKQIFDPNGGYWGFDAKGKGKHFKSVLAEISFMVQEHCTNIGLIGPEPLTIKQENELKLNNSSSAKSEKPNAKEQDASLETGVTCPECSEPNMQLLDGCYTCIKGCGHSKCG